MIQFIHIYYTQSSSSGMAHFALKCNNKTNYACVYIIQVFIVFLFARGPIFLFSNTQVLLRDCNYLTCEDQVKTAVQSPNLLFMCFCFEHPFLYLHAHKHAILRLEKIRESSSDGVPVVIWYKKPLKTGGNTNCFASCDISLLLCGCFLNQAAYQQVYKNHYFVCLCADVPYLYFVHLCFDLRHATLNCIRCACIFKSDRQRLSYRSISQSCFLFLHPTHTQSFSVHQL